MLRGMVFIDHFNFDIAAKNLFKQNNCSSPRLDYEALPRFICNQLPNIDLVKTMLFIAKPDEFLMHENRGRPDELAQIKSPSVAPQ